jgi:hypothetical protein
MSASICVCRFRHTDDGLEYATDQRLRVDGAELAPAKVAVMLLVVVVVVVAVLMMIMMSIKICQC